MDKPNLKPCPFCGSENATQYGATAFYVHCNNCGCATALFPHKEDAIAAWNRRPEDDAEQFAEPL